MKMTGPKGGLYRRNEIFHGRVYVINLCLPTLIDLKSIGEKRCAFFFLLLVGDGFHLHFFRLMGFGRLGFFHLKSMKQEPLARPMQTGLGESTTLSSVLSLRDVLSGLFWIGFHLLRRG